MLYIWFKDMKRKIKYAFQRMFKGYDSSDAYDFFDNFIEHNIKVLQHFKEHNDGVPFQLTEKEWNDIIDGMIMNLKRMDEDYVIEELSKNMPENWNPTYDSVKSIMVRNKDEFFKTLSTYFYDLWW